MPAASFWKSRIWTNFSQPRCDRALYRRVLQRKPCRIVELGIGDLTRTQRVIALAQRGHQQAIHYSGIDLFEAREGHSLKLKQVHNRLAPSGAKIRLVPGALLPALARTSNLLMQTDLLIIDSSITASDLRAAEPFLPRMLAPDTAIARYVIEKQRARIHWLSPSCFSQRGNRAA